MHHRRKAPPLRLVGLDDSATWPSPRPVEDPGPESADLKINGHAARLLAWTADVWRELDDPPDDALVFPSGLRVALRIG